MREVSAILGKEIFLGRCGENLASCVTFNLSDWQKVYGDGTAQLIHQRNGDKAPYPCVIQHAGNTVTWCIANSDVAVAGRGRAELQYYVGDTLVKSETYTTVTERALGAASETPPAPYEAWMDKMLGMASETEENAEAAEQSANAAAASAASAGESAAAAKNSEALTLSYLEDAKTNAGWAIAAADKATADMRAAEASATSAANSEAVAKSSESAAVTAATAAAEAKEKAEATVGKTSHIGANGNWYEWDAFLGAFVDTGVKAQGPKGDKGDQGNTGATGSEGPRGPQGIQGIQGPKGDTGPKGDKGDPGADGRSFSIKDVYATLAELNAAFPSGNEFAYQVKAENNEIFIWSASENKWESVGAIQGPKGDKGDTGAQGPEGPQGIQGIQGETGAQGPKGVTGDTGAQGPAGADGKTAYQSAKDGGYTGTESQFNSDLSKVSAKFNKTGDTMTGNLKLQPYGDAYSVVKKNADSSGDYGLQLQDYGDDGSFMGLTVSAKSQKLEFKKKAAGATEYTYPMIYSSDNPPAPEDVNALPIWGGTMTGALTLSGYPYQPNHAATMAYVDDTVGALREEWQASLLANATVE